MKIIYIFIFSTFLLASCVSTNTITRRSQIGDPRSTGILEVNMLDSSKYLLSNYTLGDSAISGSGQYINSSRIDYFSGEIELSKILSINAQNTSFIKSFISAGVLCVVVPYVLATLVEPRGTTITQTTKRVVPPPNNGSCPYLYSFNGSEYVLEGEAFGTALGKALESESCVVLTELKPIDDKLKIKITNERPETHFINNVQLIAVESDKDGIVYSNNHNELISVRNHKKIQKSTENGKDITNLITDRDNKYWVSDLSTANSSSGFEDKITLQIDNINLADSITLIVSAINTNISAVLFEYLNKTLGDEFPSFANAIETDPEMIGILKETLFKSALKIDIWDGSNWNYTDVLFPEANQVRFNKALRLPVPKNSNGEMKIRLRCMTDVWKIDEISYDDSAPGKLKISYPELTKYHAVAQNLTDASTIQKKDNQYLKLLPGDFTELEYKPITPNPDKKVTYALKAGGYLYEWIVDSNTNISLSNRNLNTETPKMKFLKNILKNNDLILPIIYDNWRKVRK